MRNPTLPLAATEALKAVTEALFPLRDSTAALLRDSTERLPDHKVNMVVLLALLAMANSSKVATVSSRAVMASSKAAMEPLLHHQDTKSD